MFAPKPLFSSHNLHLPALSKTNRNHSRSSPSLFNPSMESSDMSNNFSALKAKYTDYAMWLKASSRQNREPIFTHELLKHSLCQMGIDTTQAEQLVSTCSWYVYQFQKELGVDTEQSDQSTAPETKKSRQSSKRRHKETRSVKSKKTITPREHSAESAATIASQNKENSVASGSSSPIRNKFSVLPAIQPSDPSPSPHSRHVDFDNEESVGKEKSAHSGSTISKVRILPKFRSTEGESSVDEHDDLSPENTPTELDFSNSHKSLPSGHTRSILRKQTGSSSSATPTVSARRNRSRILTPGSTIIDETPLGTKSQRLFGGSKCFAEIMNELEEQNFE